MSRGDVATVLRCGGIFITTLLLLRGPFINVRLKHKIEAFLKKYHVVMVSLNKHLTSRL